MLGSKGIIREYNKGNIVINPFNESQVNPNSYDVRLGNWFISPKINGSPLSLEIPESVEAIWQAPRLVNYGNIFILEPGAYVLAHTNEFIGSHKHATLLKTRSTFGRLFIDICPSAGFGDVGYTNRWTLEIKNNSNNHYILHPSMRIAQISFMEVKEKGKVYQGAYNGMTWVPEDMLPKLGIERVF